METRLAGMLLHNSGGVCAHGGEQCGDDGDDDFTNPLQGFLGTFFHDSLGFRLRFVVAFVLLGSPVGVGLTLLLCVQGCSLCGAGGGLFELGVAAQVEQCAALGEVDLEVGDVLGGEVGHCHGTLAGDGGRERAQFSEVNLIALQDEFADATAELAEDAEDGALAEHAVVLTDVGAELAEADYAGELDQSKCLT